MGPKTSEKRLISLAHKCLMLVTESVDQGARSGKANELTVLCSRDKVLLKVAARLREAVLGEVESPFEKAGLGNSVLARYNSYISDL